jgi:hypothetical protein
MSKIICILLNISLFVGFETAQAQFDYVTNADETSVTITGYSGPDAVIIPQSINGLAVTDIGQGAFENANITSVTFPTNLTNIAYDAFAFCANLTNVVFPNTILILGDDVFSESGLTTVTIPNSLINIGVDAFSCQSLTNITFDFGFTDIQSSMFAGCTSLEDVVIPSSVTNIGDAALGGCESLTNIFFGGNAPAVGQFAFVNTSNIDFHGTVYYYIATAYYLPGTSGWDQFQSNTLMLSNEWHLPTNIYVPAMLWNPKIQVSGTNFGVQNGQYGFDITATTNLPIAVEACDDLSQSNWVVLQRLTLTNGLFHFSEPFQTNTLARFYRIGFP